jgi:hypothetical protein
MKFSFILIATALFFVSCAHHDSADRKIAAESCWNTVKPEYHSYFDSVEKCLEKAPQ